MTGLPYFARAHARLPTDVEGATRPRRRRRGRTGGSRRDGVRAGRRSDGVVEGSFAELAVGSAATLVRKPARLSFEQAAAAPISGLTALQALRDVIDVKAGQRVLVIGAGGGVGTLAVQIAKASGAHVTGVCSGAKAELVRSLGADDVIDYTREDFTDGRRTWDAIVDTAGRRSLRSVRRALAPRGTLAIVGGDGGGKVHGRVLPPDPARARAVAVQRPAPASRHLEGDPGGPRGTRSPHRGWRGHPGGGSNLRAGGSTGGGPIPGAGARSREGRRAGLAGTAATAPASRAPLDGLAHGNFVFLKPERSVEVARDVVAGTNVKGDASEPRRRASSSAKTIAALP